MGHGYDRGVFECQAGQINKRANKCRLNIFMCFARDSFQLSSEGKQLSSEFLWIHDNLSAKSYRSFHFLLRQRRRRFRWHCGLGRLFFLPIISFSLDDRTSLSLLLGWLCDGKIVCMFQVFVFVLTILHADKSGKKVCNLLLFSWMTLELVCCASMIWSIPLLETLFSDISAKYRYRLTSF